MGNFTLSEILTIVIVILIVFGPRRLPEFAHRAGTWVARARAAVNAFRDEFMAEYGEAVGPIKEAGEDIRRAGQDILGTVSAYSDEVVSSGDDAETEGEADASGDPEDTAEPEAGFDAEESA